MNIVATSFDGAEPSVVISDDPDAFSAFLQPDCAAAVWRRQVPTATQSWLNALDPEVLPRGRVILPSQTVADTVAHLFDMAGVPDGAERDWLHADIVSLAQMFGALMQARFLRLRLEPVTTNACRKFHLDAITARLVCTYRGTGTQYGVSTDGGNPKRVLTVPTGAPILLRGSLWPAVPDRGLLHRSPPIEGSGETRLLLVLDPIFDPDNEE